MTQQLIQQQIQQQIQQHADLPDAGRIAHDEIDKVMEQLRRAPIRVNGQRDDPESALRNLLTALEQAGLIFDNTSTT